MKKSLLTLGAALLLSAGAFAQTHNSCNTATDAGNTIAITDNFASEAGPSGVFYWGNSEGSAFSFERSTTGKLEITVNHGEGQLWSPMGLDINFAAEGADEGIYVDASEGTLAVSITNPGDQAIEVYFTALSNGKTGDEAQIATASVDGDNVTLWGGVIDANSTVEWEFDLDSGKKRTWQANEEACTELGGTLISGTNNCIEDGGFDVENLSGVEFSINGAASAETSWQNSTLENYDVEVGYIQVGECTTVNQTPGGDAPIILAAEVEDDVIVVGVEAQNEVLGLLVGAIDADDNEYDILVVEDSEGLTPESEDVDVIIEGVFETDEDGTIIGFELDDDALPVGEYDLIFVAFDSEELVTPEESVYTLEYDVVGLTEAEIAALDVKVSPNPASDVVNVTYNVPADETVSVVLSSAVGQEVASVEGSTSGASVDVSNLDAGLYFASIVVDGVVVATQKVIVE
ncbi:MAG: T9SS type A sorting domain-containing protein [Cytophagales bacterium]|nr:T9SS type A sorting domain-containing protein [Cytophagales bacterium]